MSTMEQLAARVAQLEMENRRLLAMFDALDDHVILLDLDSRVLFLNRGTEAATQANYGVSRAEMIGRNISDGEPSQFKDYVKGLVERARAGETVTGEFLLPMPTGAVWREHHVLPVYGPEGDVEAVAVSSRNIQARKQAEGRLQLLSKIGLLTDTTDLDGLQARAASLAIPELADWSILELVHDGEVRKVTVSHPDRDKAAEAERRLAQTRVNPRLGAHLYQVEVDDDQRPELRDVLRLFESSSAIVVPFVIAGAPIAIATFAYGPESSRRHTRTDLVIAEEVARRAAQIVENARLHAEVEDALAYRERVMAILGHDLLNPVSAVLSIAATLSQRPDVPDRAKEGLRHVRAAAERMGQMIAMLLDFTQLRFRGPPRLIRDSLDLDKLARSILDELRAAHPTREILLDARGELRGRFDVSRMGQVISNLVANALTHGDRTTPISVTLTSDDASIYLAVANRGPAISRASLGKLFEPFWQAPEGEAKARGLGLGLFIVQQIVHAHEGTIAVSSDHEGTRFTVRLPR